MNDKNNITYKPTLDGVRGFACLLVVASHLFDGIELLGSLGVMIFFALSGFLMSMLYLHKSWDSDSVYKYAISRFSRIVPAYYIATIFCIILYWVIPGFYDMTFVNSMRNFLFVGYTGVFWSIPPEIQFYVFFILAWYSYIALIKKNYIPIIVLSILAVILISTRGMWPDILLPSRLHIFLLGAIAAYLIKYNKVSALLQLPFVQIIMLAITSVCYYIMLINEIVISNSLIFALLIATTVASLSYTTSITKILELKYIRFLGAASFSIYLFHVPIITILETFILPLENSSIIYLICVGLVSIGVPCLFYKFAEKRLNISCKNWLMDKQEKLVKKTNIMPAIMFAVLYTFTAIFFMLD